MILEEQRLLHEDLERLEEAIAERLHEDPQQVGRVPASSQVIFAPANIRRFANVLLAIMTSLVFSTT